MPPITPAIAIALGPSSKTPFSAAAATAQGGTVKDALLEEAELAEEAPALLCITGLLPVITEPTWRDL